MFGIMLQKMWHKRWMNLSLLLGCILLVATAVSFPLYQEAAYDRMVQDEFESFVTTEGTWPAEVSITIVSKKDRTGAAITSLENLMGDFYRKLNVQEKETIRLYTFAKQGIHSEMERPDADELSVKLGAKSGIENHVNMLSGEMFSETGVRPDGALEVVISQSCMVAQGLLVGETIVFDALKDFDGNIMRLYIAGVFEEKEDGSYYWQEADGTFDNVCFMNMNLFREMFTGDHAAKYDLTCTFTPMFEFEGIRAGDVDELLANTKYYTTESAYRSVMTKPRYQDVLETYNVKKARITATLSILQIPVMIMLAAFLLMISSQMYEMERNEISVIKSRGSTRGQIFRMYFFQALVLVTAGALVGIPLGMLLSRLLGSTRNFLVFDLSDTLNVHFTQNGAIYAGAAMLLGLMCLTLPAIKHSKVSIVNLKQQKAMRKKPLWEKLYLDIVLLAVAGYGYYNFNHSGQDLSHQVLKGETLDPLLYISSSLLIIGGGLLFLRLQPILLNLIYQIGKKRWRPASYISFMENTKNVRKQQLIMLFLIMTVSLGMYHSTVARTIVENAMANTQYLDGADLIMKEVWLEIKDREGALTGKYVEPDVKKYYTADIFDKYTKVYYDTAASATAAKNKVDITLMGIHTKEYGELSWVDTKLNGVHYYNLLNELASDTKGLLVSSNFRDKLGLKQGDTVNYANGKGITANGVIIDFFDYWPGYSPTSAMTQPDGNLAVVDNYLVIAHFDTMTNKLGQQPYEIWAQLKDGITKEDVYSWITANDVHLTKYQNRVTDLQQVENDPLLQGTNGVLTMGFVVTILLCGVGYLIYWIMSIRERELVFGVLRASGFHKGELFHMLINEQVFCGLLSILAGFGIGKLTSALFVPILQQAYSSIDQVLPMELITNSTDIQRLVLVITLVMVVCLLVLTGMLMRMNVAKALKLGED